MRTYTRKENAKRFFMPGEWIRFLNIISKEQHRFWFEFLLHTGMRYNEAKNIAIQDINFERELILIRIAKGGRLRQRTIQISDYLARRIKSYIEAFKPKITLDFPSIVFLDRKIKSYCQEAGITDYKNFSCHNLRKTLENWLVALNINALAIQAHVGHTIDVAMTYYISTNILKAEDKALIKSILDNLLNK